jgi:hypothetical protein
VSHHFDDPWEVRDMEELRALNILISCGRRRDWVLGPKRT